MNRTGPPPPFSVCEWFVVAQKPFGLTCYCDYQKSMQLNFLYRGHLWPLSEAPIVLPFNRGFEPVC